jgi:hypothetical protein
MSPLLQKGSTRVRTRSTQPLPSATEVTWQAMKLAITRGQHRTAVQRTQWRAVADRACRIPGKLQEGKEKKVTAAAPNDHFAMATQEQQMPQSPHHQRTTPVPSVTVGAVHELSRSDWHHKQGSKSAQQHTAQLQPPALRQHSRKPPVAEELLLLLAVATAVEHIARGPQVARRNVTNAACCQTKVIPLLRAANGRCQSLHTPG